MRLETETQQNKALAEAARPAYDSGCFMRALQEWRDRNDPSRKPYFDLSLAERMEVNRLAQEIKDAAI